MIDLEGNLDNNRPSLLLASTLAGDARYVESLIEHLARDLGADLISFDMEDLEDLALAFYDQDSNKEARKKNLEESWKEQERAEDTAHTQVMSSAGDGGDSLQEREKYTSDQEDGASDGSSKFPLELEKEMPNRAHQLLHVRIVLWHAKAKRSQPYFQSPTSVTEGPSMPFLAPFARFRRRMLLGN